MPAKALPDFDEEEALELFPGVVDIACLTVLWKLYQSVLNGRAINGNAARLFLEMRLGKAFGQEAPAELPFDELTINICDIDSEDDNEETPE